MALLASKSLTLVKTFDQESLNTIFDHGKIVQVLINLIGNAIKFTPNGKIITISCVKSVVPGSESTVGLTISDEGVGIPASELELVFDKFAQSSKTTNGSGGTGAWGLAIVKEIVLAHKGTVCAFNNSGVGASFAVILPLR